jgi:hypothetical protein
MDRGKSGNPSGVPIADASSGVAPEEKKNIFIISTLIIFLALALLVAGCRSITGSRVGGAVAPLPSTTPILTVTPLPNPQLHPGEILYSSQFDSVGVWDIGHADDNFATQDRKVENGKYIWNATARHGFLDFSLPSTNVTIPDDGYQISVDANMVEGPPDSSFGIVFDLVDGDNYWIWNIDGDGTGTLSECVAGSYVDAPMAVFMVIPHEYGETHTYTLKLSPDTLYFYADGAQFGSFKTSDPVFVNFTNGKKFGLAIDLQRPGDQAKFEFDNFVISHPVKIW